MSNRQYRARLPNPFDPAALRLDQSFADSVGVKKRLMTVPVRKPNRQDFVRVHPDPSVRLTPAAIIEVKEDREVYLVTPNMAQELPGEFAAATLFTAINRQGVLHLWPVKLPGPDGKHNEWHRSAAEAAELAMKRWVRLTANMSLGAYEVFEATGDLPEPVWPEIPFHGNPEDRFPGPYRRSRGPSAGAAPARPSVSNAGRCRIVAGRPTAGRRRRCRRADKLASESGGIGGGHRTGLASSRSEKFGSSTSSSARRPAKILSPCASSHGNCGADDELSVWRDEFGTAPPYPTGADALFVCYYASAEISCHLALGWPVPERVLDLFTEFRNQTNGVPTDGGAGLLGALAYHGLDGIGAIEKDDMRALVLRGGPWSDAERAAILDYCESDVAALARLLPAMLPCIDLPRALLRGRYMAAAARIERNGVPIDVSTLELLKRNWSNIQDQLIAEIDADYGVSMGGHSRRTDSRLGWLRSDIPWPVSKAVGSIWAMTRSGRWRAPTRRSRRCANCAARYPKCDCPILPSAGTAVIARCCQPSGHAPDATSRATPSSFSVRAFGCAG